MKMLRLLICIFCTVELVAIAPYVAAQDKDKSANKAATSAPDPAKGKDAKLDPKADPKAAAPAPRAPVAGPALSFLPPAPGAPIRREGGATRGGGDSREMALSVVAPAQAGWASNEQPFLYWFSSRPVTTPAFLTINPTSGPAIDPLYEGMVAATADGGIQAISLAALGVKLIANTDYEWSISLVADAKSPSRDLVASGRIRFAPLAADLRASLVSANESDQATQFARAGYWYDVVRLMRQKFADSDAEVSLYEAAGLSRIAKYLRAGS